MTPAMNRRRAANAARLALILAAGALALRPSAGRADPVLTLQAPALGAAPGSSGSFDVTITNDGNVAETLSSFQFELVAGPGVSFDAVTTATDPVAAPYVFGTSGYDDENGLSLWLNQPTDASGNPLPGDDLLAQDTDGAPFSYVTLAPGQTYGLAHVDYSVDGGAAGSIALGFVGGSTILTDGALDISTQSFEDYPGGSVAADNGSIGVVAEGAAVPEPSSLVASATALMLTLLARELRRRANGPMRRRPAQPTGASRSV